MGKSSDKVSSKCNFSKKAVGRPRKSENFDAQSLADAAQRYFDKCDSRTKEVMTKDGIERISSPAPYSIEGLCSYIGVLRNTFYTWRQREDELGFQAELIHQMITANRMEGALDGTQNSSFAQFLLKNNNSEHYRDRVEIEGSVAADAVSMFTEWSRMWKEMK
jgi:hypothetical protein